MLLHKPDSWKKIFEWKEQIENQQMLVKTLLTLTQPMKILKP